MNSTPGDSGQRPTPPGGLTGTVVRGVAFAATGFALTQVLTLGSYVVLARLATPTEFGQLASGMVLVGIGLVLTESGMMSALIYQRDRIEEAAATAVISTFVGGLALGLLALAFSPLIGLYFDSETVAMVAAAVSGIVLVQALRVVPEALLQRRFSFFRRMVVEPCAAIAFGATAVVLVSNGYGVWGLVLGQYASALTDVVLSWGLVRWRPQLRLASFAMWRELIAYGRHTIAATTVIRIGGELPVLLLGRFTGTAAVGQFRYGIRIAALPLALLMAAASYVIFPALARIAEERDRFHAAFLRALRWMAMLAIPGGLILVPLGEPLAVLVFGPTWADAGKAAMALALFTSGRALTSLIVEALKADGRPDVVVRMNAVEVVVGAAAMIALLGFGLIGVCLGIATGVVVRAAYAFHKCNRVVGVPLAPMLHELRAPLLAGVAMVAVLLPLELFIVDAESRGVAMGLLLLAAEAGLGLTIYSALIHILVPGTGGELARLLRSSRLRRSPAKGGGEDESRPSGVSAG